MEPRPARAEAEGVRKRSKAVPASPFVAEPRSLSAYPDCCSTGSASSYSHGKWVTIVPLVPLGQRRHIHMVKLNRRTRYHPEVAQYAVAYPSVVAQNRIPATNCTSLGGFGSLVNMTSYYCCSTCSTGSASSYSHGKAE